jgi:integrase
VPSAEHLSSFGFRPLGKGRPCNPPTGEIILVNLRSNAETFADLGGSGCCGPQRKEEPFRPRSADPTKILTRRELAAVLSDLKRKAPRALGTRLNLAVYRLVACCGLRASEIAKLRLADVRTELVRPHLRIRTGASKGGRSRIVSLWWDAGTLADLSAWKSERLGQGAAADQPFVASIHPARSDKAFSRQTLCKRFRTACKVLGAERLEALTIHHGPHTFISHALAGGRTLAKVRDAVGHSNVSITSAYLHVAVDDDELGSLFEFKR